MWSGGSFIYVPPGVHVDIPLQAYFRINTENMGQFERTLIIVDEGAYVHYVEGCTAPIYKSDSLHSAVVEIIVKKGGRCRYTTIQNWSNNVYNLVTKRAKAYEGATMEWVDGNLGSKVTMKYPAVLLMGEHAKGEVLSIAFAGEGQHQDAGAKMTHLAPHTSSTIISKSVARGGGRTSYRGLVRVNPNAHHSRSTVKCDALLVDTISRSDTYPYVDVRTDDVSMGHEATVSKVSDDQLFYLMSRGLTEDEAMAMVVRGFVEPIARELPMEYALELNRLIELQMEGVGRMTRVRTLRRTLPVSAPELKGAKEGQGEIPAASAGERFTSYDVEAFEVPGGREENWRFTPLRRLRGLHDGSAPLDGVAVVEIAGAGEGVTVERVTRDDARVGEGGVPADRVAAQAWSAAPDVTIVTLDGRPAPLDITVTGPGAGASAAAHLQLRTRPFAEATVVLTHVGSGALADNLEVVLADGARLTLVVTDEWADDAVHVGAQHLSLGRDATLKVISVALGGDLVRISPTVAFRGPGGDVELVGLGYADAGQHLEQRLLVDHAVPNCRSNVLYKNALQGDGAHTVWIGDVLIRAAAENTETFEFNRNLVLTERARADSVPNLEIETGEITGAGHASATGRFDDEQLFYLQSRGIPEDVARRLVVRGFFGEILARLPLPELRERLEAAIEAELAVTGV